MPAPQLVRLAKPRLACASWVLGGLLCALSCVLGCDSSSVDIGSNASDGGQAGTKGHAGARSGSKPDAGNGRGCPMGFADCDGDAANGCEVDLARERDHCGRCGNACASADCVCQDGALVAHCTNERADCNGDPRDGCEVDMTSDANHCGSCERACPSRGFDAFGASCVDGRCMLVCEVGMADCDADPSTGCEVLLFFDNRNCGACGVSCNCNGGRCTN